jgi:purine-nucleoside phosphorylase
MAYPVFPDKYKLLPLLRAEDMIEFRRQHGGLGSLPAPRSAVLCLYKGAMRRFGWTHPSRRAHGFLGDVYLLKRTQGRVAVLGNFGIGAPAITSIADELMAWGVKHLAILSLAGGLQPGLAPGSIVIADRAIRDEGTSYHYLPPGKDVQASSSLVSAISAALHMRGLPVTVGAVWSTDAPYRETREEADFYRGEGVQAVDMESAGLFAAAQVRGAQATSVFVIGDSLAGPRWSGPPNMRMLHLRLKSLLDSLIGALSSLE